MVPTNTDNEEDNNHNDDPFQDVDKIDTVALQAKTSKGYEKTVMKKQVLIDHTLIPYNCNNDNSRCPPTLVSTHYWEVWVERSSAHGCLLHVHVHVGSLQ